VAVDDVHAGKVIPKTRIAHCDGRQVTFTDGTAVEADLIIDCSGFAPDFPFLPKQVELADLHRLVFDRNDPTLSFVGTAMPVLGSVPALAEMQARYIAAVYSGRVHLPHPNEQEMDGFYAARQHRKRFLDSTMRPNLVDHEYYADDIARNTGVSVPWIRILLRSRKQFKMLLLAPWMAFKYELRGDHSERAMAHITEHMPREPEYYQIIKRRFAKPLKIMWLIQAVTLALILTFLPSYLVVTLALGFLAQQLLRSRAARKARIA
jgi:dimethylaniline monooxygenase (N-oxide forming)